MTIQLKHILIVGLTALSFTSCKLETIEDPNNPSIGSVTHNATKGQLQTLITGVESRSRGYLSTTANALGTFGREIWYFNSSDARFVQVWTGQTVKVPDANFYSVGSIYASPYQTIKQANVLLEAADNTQAINEQERFAIRGFAKTIQGYQYIIPANALYTNGIRIDVADESNPGPFVSYEEALQAIRKILDEGYADLQKAGTTFPFKLTAGFNGFNTPAGLGKVNRALAARVAIYQKDWTAALNYLKDSFLDPNQSFDLGPSHVYGGPPDTFNPLFYVLNASVSSIGAVHPSLLTDAIPGDKRVEAKFFKRSSPLVNTVGTVPLSSDYQDKRWATNSSPIPFIRNEELILIKAEAEAQLANWDNSIESINQVRAKAGIGAYTGAKNKDALITEILFQRRYSLWYEPSGHRWVDLRRYNRLNEIPVDLDKGTVFEKLERPLSEWNWDDYVSK